MAAAGLGGAFAGLGGLASGLIGNAMIGNAENAASQTYGQGRDYLASQNAQQRSDFKPYMQAGQQGLTNYQNTLAQGSGAVNPSLSKAFDYNQWQDPSTQYRIDQSNAAINASALAKGNVGGGLAKALAGNAQNMASQEYANAYDRYLKQNTQDFGQQQQLWNNANQNWQTQLSGQQNLANMGLSAAGATGQLGLGYSNAYNQNLMNQAQMQYGSGLERAGAVGGGLKSAFSGLSSLI